MKNKIKRFGEFINEQNEILLAPNGKPSNLSSELYEMVRTPEFIDWFGDWINDPTNSSKVVDENGEPLVMYHYSFHDFDMFDKKKHPKIGDIISGDYFKPIGYDFSSSIGFYKRSESFEYKCFLNCKKLLEPINLQNDNKIKNILFDLIGNSISLRKSYSNYVVPETTKEDYFKRLIMGEWDVIEIPQIVKYISKKYDGTYMMERDWKNIKVFDNANIKIIEKTKTPIKTHIYKHS